MRILIFVGGGIDILIWYWYCSTELLVFLEWIVYLSFFSFCGYGYDYDNVVYEYQASVLGNTRMQIPFLPLTII